MALPGSPGGMVAVPIHQALGCAVSAQMYPVTMAPYPMLPAGGTVLMQLPGPPLTQIPQAAVTQAANYKLEAPQLVHGSQQRSPSPRWADMGADDP